MRRLRLFVLLLILTLLLTACGASEPPPAASAVLTAMLAAMESTAQPIPDGVIRLTAASEDSSDRLTAAFFSALYGEAARGLLESAGEGNAPVASAALFLSMAPYPCELGVFYCADETTARSVAALCRGRLDTLARGYEGSEWESLAAAGRVEVAGCYVLLVLCEDPRAPLETARSLCA